MLRCASWLSCLFIWNAMWMREMPGSDVLPHYSKCVRMMRWLKPRLIWNDYSMHLIWLWHHSVSITSQTQVAKSSLLTLLSWSCQGIKPISHNCKCPNDDLNMQCFQTSYVGTNVSPCGQQTFPLLALNCCGTRHGTFSTSAITHNYEHSLLSLKHALLKSPLCSVEQKNAR